MRVFARLAARAGHARLGVDHDVGDQLRRGERGKREDRCGREAARTGDEVRARDLIAVELGQAVDRPLDQLGVRVLDIPALVGCEVAQAKVGGEVDHPYATAEKLGDERRRGGVRVGDDRRVYLRVALEIELLHDHVHPMLGVDVAMPAPGLAARGDRGELELRVAVDQSRGEGARVTGGAGDEDARHGAHPPRCSPVPWRSPGGGLPPPGRSACDRPRGTRGAARARRDPARPDRP